MPPALSTTAYRMGDTPRRLPTLWIWRWARIMGTFMEKPQGNPRVLHFRKQAARGRPLKTGGPRVEVASFYSGNKHDRCLVLVFMLYTYMGEIFY